MTSLWMLAAVLGPLWPGPPAPYAGSLGESGTRALYFVVNSQQWTADHGAAEGYVETVLGRLFDTNVAWIVPGSGKAALKIHATPEVNCITGDLDQDGDFFEVHWGDIDSLGVRRYGVLPTRPTTAEFVFSSQNAWGGAEEGSPYDNGGATDGTLFRLLRDEDGQFHQIRRFLTEWIILDAVGQASESTSDGLDVDAFTQDEYGNVFLSFRHEEYVHGVLLGDEGVVCLPAFGLWYDGDFNVANTYPGSARIVLDAQATNALVAHAGLQRPSGSSILSAGNLQALELDPAGGMFSPVEWVPGLGEVTPDLLFNTERIGPTVLSTAGGGRIATLNGALLGSSVIHGAALGLDPLTTAKPTADLNGILVVPFPGAQICVDASQAQVDLHGTGPDVIEFVAGTFTPLSGVWVFYDAVSPPIGGGLASIAAPEYASYPDLLVPNPALIELHTSDAFGRLVLRTELDPAPPVPFWVVVQAFDTQRKELSTPAGIWCPWP